MPCSYFWMIGRQKVWILHRVLFLPEGIMLGNSQGNFKFQVEDLIDQYFRLVKVTAIKPKRKWSEDRQITGISKLKTVCPKLALCSGFMTDSTTTQGESVLWLKDALLLVNSIPKSERFKTMANLNNNIQQLTLYDNSNSLRKPGSFMHF